MQTALTRRLFRDCLNRMFPLGVMAALIAPPASLWADQTLIPAQSAWKYLANGSNQGTAWRASGFDDSTWASGPAELGYGDASEGRPEATVISYGPDPNNKYITTYFRKSFQVIDPTAFAGLTLRVMRDDGVAVYLNGAEVYRNNLPATALSYTTLATSAIGGADEYTFQQAGIGTANLVAGANVIAVELHQSGGTSSDVSFDLELIGVDTASVTRGPYLQNVTPSSVIVRWRTGIATDSRVRYGTSAGQLTQESSDGTLTTEHAVTLTGLSPDTLYYYVVGTSTADLTAGSGDAFFTAPVPGSQQPMRFWLVGDAGTGNADQANVRNAYYSHSADRYTDLVLFLGDNAYDNGTDAEYQTKLFDVYGSLLRRSPAFSTIGNHDTAGSTNPDLNTTPYFRIFNLPASGEGGGVASGTEKYYSFNYGNVHFVCLDSMTSDRSGGGPMLTWLQADLAQNMADWLIAFWHHPPYTKGSHNSDTETELVQMRQNALPILESYGVDLILSGHSHSYERSMLLDGHYGTSGTLSSGMVLNSGSGRDDTTDGAYLKTSMGPSAHQGAVYAVAGSAGKISGGTLNHPAMFISLNQLGSLVLDVDVNRLDARFITSTGLTNDYFTVRKGSAGNLPPAVSITAPTDGATFVEGVTISITATALDSDGAVVSVGFYQNNALLGIDADGPPWSFDWAGAPRGSYSLVAVATDNLGAQAQSMPVGLSVVAPPPPAAPSGLDAAPASSSSIALVWTDNAGSETGFVIERSTSRKFQGAAQILVGPNTTSYLDTGLAASTTYYYRVRAYNSEEGSAWSNTDWATTPAFQPTSPPAAPSNLTATPISRLRMSLAWTDNSADEQGFTLERSRFADFATIEKSVSLAKDSTSYTDNKLVSGVTYYYRVRSYNAIGPSGPSNTATATAGN